MHSNGAAAVATQKLPERWCRPWVDDGHIQHLIDLLAEFPEHVAQTTGFWRQQMLIGAFSGGLFGRAEAGAFEKIQDAHRVFLEAPTAVGQRLPISGPPAPHVRKAQQPHGQAQQRDPDEFLLGKEFQRRHDAAKGVLQQDDVGPGLMIGNDQVAPVQAHRFRQLHAQFQPVQSERRGHHAIATHPAVYHPIHPAVQTLPQAGKRQQHAHQPHEVERCAPDGSIQSQEGRRQGAAQKIHSSVDTISTEPAPADASLIYRFRFPATLLYLALLAPALSGCATVGFYQQAIGGQLGLLRARIPVEEVLADPATDPALAQRLQRAQSVLAYAEQTLGLPVEDSYSAYVALAEPYVVWNLVVASPDSVDARRWCFPVAGCVAYRGYFNPERARRNARRFADRGWDVHVAGVAAYSTLGWFDDPLLSSFVNWPDPALGELLLHELAHRLLYVPGDTAFNESFATFVARTALPGWLGQDGALLDAHRANQRDAERFETLLLALRGALAREFAAAPDRAAALAARQRLWTQADACYVALRARFSGNRYDGYFAQPPNTARLALISAYRRWLPAFAQLFQREGRQWPAFFQAVRELAAQVPEARERQLQALLDAHPPATEPAAAALPTQCRALFAAADPVDTARPGGAGGGMVRQ